MLRLHFAFLPLTAGMAGMAVGAENPTVAGMVIGLIICASAYPIGQVANDYTDRKADAINAPTRPLVTGEIKPRVALAVVGTVAIVLIVAAWFIAPGAAIWLVVGFVGHGIYTLVKGVPLLGNVANGVDLAVFTLVGAAAAAPTRAAFDLPSDVIVLFVLEAIMLSGFCLVTYFKDVPGDTAAGYRTLVVVLGAQRARWLAIPWSVIAVGGACYFALVDPGRLGSESANVGVPFWILAAATALVQGITLVLLFRSPIENAYRALVWQGRAAVLFALTLGAVARPWLFLLLAAPLLALQHLPFRWTRGTGQA